MEKTYVTFDPRSQLALILFASFLLVFPARPVLEYSFIILLYLLFLLSGQWKKGSIFLGIYFGLFLANFLLTTYMNSAIGSFFTFLFVGNQKMFPTIMAAAFASSQVSISEWVAALKKCRVPFSAIVSLMVFFRFFPTLIQDMKSIRNAMRYRGIALSTVDLLIHPFQTMEFLIIPMLMTAENTSYDLSAAALVRGLANPGEHTSIYKVQLRAQDYILFLLLFGGILWRLFL